MKGQIIDVSSSEAFVLLQDDTVLKIPITEINNLLSVSSMVNITPHSGTFASNNNHIHPRKSNTMIDYY